VLKLILTFDEGFVFSRFPNRKDNVFARSIDYVFPTDLFSFNDNISSINRSSFTVPDEKHFGFNFAKLANGYLEMRYMGGKDYEDHIKEILECMDYAVSTIYDCLSKPGYTEENVTRLRGRLIEHKKFINGIINHKVFSVFYKKIEIYVDLKNSDQLLATYWEEYRKVLFDLIYKNGLKSGFINLDIDLHRYQVKDGVFEKPWSLSSYDLVDCKLKNSTLDQCTMIGCKVKSSQVSFCEIMIDNTIDDSKIKSCHIKTLHNTFTNCYIDNMPHNVKGNIVNCIIRSGGISDLTTMDNKTVVVSV
jgi:predicted ester cyclase